MLEITKLLYIHHNVQIGRIGSVLSVLAQHTDSKISKIAMALLSKVDAPKANRVRDIPDTQLINIFLKTNQIDIPK